MTTGGRGFGILEWKGKKVAYLQPWPWNSTQVPKTGQPPTRDNRHWLLYMIENPETLATLIPLMQQEITEGRLTLFRLIKNPWGEICRFDCDITSTTVEFPEGNEFVNPDNEHIGKELFFATDDDSQLVEAKNNPDDV